MDDLVSLCRFTLAVAFLLSAGWKAIHPAHFDAVLAGGPRAVRRLTRRLPRVSLAIAALEAALALALLLVSEHWVPALAAVAFLAAFSAFLARADSLANGCGCWRPPQAGTTRAAPYLVRNAMLAALAAAGGLGGGVHGAGTALMLAVLAVLPALLVMEIPTIAELAWPARSQPRSVRGT